MIKVKWNLTENNEIINYSNRGMILENEINETAKYLLENNICLIYKKATPIKIVKVENCQITISDVETNPETAKGIPLSLGNIGK